MGAGLVTLVDRALSGNLLARAERFEGKAGQELHVTTLGRLPACRVVLLGVGPRERALEEARRRRREGLPRRAGGGVRSLAVAVPTFLAGEEAGAARALVEGALLGAYFVRAVQEAGRRASVSKGAPDPHAAGCRALGGFR